MLIGVVGKSNVGKSTLFSAATMVDVEISNRIFTTIKPNQGTSYVTSKCVHSEKFEKCDPVNSKCDKGIRMTPLTLLDVAGLVPGAHEGKGLGNQFMSDLMMANAFIHVVDCSGSTDGEGNAVEKGSHNPCDDIRFLEKEVDYWINGILTKNWSKISKQAAADVKGPGEALAKQLCGLGMSEDDIKDVLARKNFGNRPDQWDEDEVLRFASEIRKKSKPMLIAANKIDVPGAKENFEKIQQEFPDYVIVPCCAEAELALRKAAKSGVIKYVPGENKFEVIGELKEKQKKALEFIRKNILDVFDSTGVQKAINETAFNLLKLIVVYPVQDTHKWCSGKGHVLPDTHLIPKDSTAIQLAGIIHTDFAERFVTAIDCRTGKNLGKDAPLGNNQIIAIKVK